VVVRAERRQERIKEHDMNVDAFKQVPVVSIESQADFELAEDQARQADLSQAMDRVEADVLQAKRVTRQHMVAELDVQREEGEQERAEVAIAAAESEGLAPRTAPPLAEPGASGPTGRRWGLVRRAGRVAAVLAVLGVVVVGCVLLVRRRRH
jgi:hypothetical protein